MVTTLYLVRHAEAEGNINETFQGMIDTNVTDKGEKQLACLAERFRDIPITALYSSPLRRTRATADAVNRYHQLPVQLDDRLVEINGGDWEGVAWADLPERFPKEYNDWQTNMSAFAAPNGETMQAVFDRMKHAVADLAARHPGETIAVVSHGCALRNFLCFAANDPITKLCDVGWADNTAVSCVTYENGAFTLLFKNDASHLPPELSTLATSRWCKYESDDFRTDETYVPGGKT